MGLQRPTGRVTLLGVVAEGEKVGERAVCASSDVNGGSNGGSVRKSSFTPPHPAHLQPGAFAPVNDFGKRTILWVDLPAVARWVAGPGATGGEGEGEGVRYVLELAPAAGKEEGGESASGWVPCYIWALDGSVMLCLFKPHDARRTAPTHRPTDQLTNKQTTQCGPGPARPRTWAISTCSPSRTWCTPPPGE